MTMLIRELDIGDPESHPSAFKEAARAASEGRGVDMVYHPVVGWRIWVTTADDGCKFRPLVRLYDHFSGDGFFVDESQIIRIAARAEAGVTHD